MAGPDSEDRKPERSRAWWQEHALDWFARIITRIVIEIVWSWYNNGSR